MLFNKRLLKQKINKLDFEQYPEIENAKAILSKWHIALTKSDLDKTKETGVQGQFLIKIFEGVLGYKTQSEGGSEWNMFAEPKTEVDSREADGGLGFFNTESNQTRVVVELKDAKTNLDAKQKGRKNDQSPVEQAFDYLSKFDGCKWAIVSNFKEIRLYSKERGQGFYEEIDLLKIHEEEELKKFIFLFSKENLINKERDSVIDDLLKDSFVKEQDISKSFYKTYKETRSHLFNHLSSNNQTVEASILLEKAQKILDRVIFICFCEDLDLIPNGIFRKLLEAAKLSFAPSETKVWDQAKGLFHSIDKGNPPLNINKFNGGLFKEDQILDSLIIKDEIILELLKLSEYDFDSDLNVNILGHIFEQSISDLEEIRLQLTEEPTDKKNRKRKKDGIFYTPEYITRYIVDQAVGGWLMDRKKELGFELLPELTDEDFKSIKTRKGVYKGNNTIEKYRKFWEAYKEKLRNIKVLDPACGSGAFLNQVFDYLYKEGQVVNEALASLTLGQAEIFDLDKHILNNNIFGVDLNEESAQITKLSLWLKTANKSKELTTLDENIKCGNSLIDDPLVAGEKAFDWKTEFKEIFDNGGFDVVVGNPPYVPAESISQIDKTFYERTYKTAYGRLNLYILFYEKGYDLLAKDGFLSFISPYTILKNQYFIEGRRLLLQNTTINEIIDFTGSKVFEDAIVDSIVLTFNKSIPVKMSEIKYISQVRDLKSNDYLSEEINQLGLLTAEDLAITTIQNNPILKKTINNSIKLKFIVDFKQGVITGNNKEFVTNERNPLSVKVLTGGDINKYSLVYPGTYLTYDTVKLHRPRVKKIFEAPRKILLRQTGSYPIATIDTESYYTLDTIHNGTMINDKFLILYILGILNSDLMRYVYNKLINETGKVFAQVKIIYIDELPIREVNLEQQTVVAEKVEKLISLNKNIEEIKGSFLDFMKNKWRSLNLNTKIKNWYQTPFQELLREFESQKIKLTLEEQNEWLNFVESRKEVLFDLYNEQKFLNQEINSIVNNIYSLNNEEINIINNSANE
jgi:hypothetical protein